MEESWVCGDFAGAEQGQGVVLDGGGPVGGVGVEGVEQGFLDSRQVVFVNGWDSFSLYGVVIWQKNQLCNVPVF